MGDTKRTFEAEIMAFIDRELERIDAKKRAKPTIRRNNGRLRHVPFSTEMIHRIIARIQEL